MNDLFYHFYEKSNDNHLRLKKKNDKGQILPLYDAKVFIFMVKMDVVLKDSDAFIMEIFLKKYMSESKVLNA